MGKTAHLEKEVMSPYVGMRMEIIVHVKVRIIGKMVKNFQIVSLVLGW